MEVLILLLLIILLVTILNQNSKLTQHIQRLEKEFKLIRNQLSKFTTDEPEPDKNIVPEKPVPAEETKPYKSLFTVADDKTIPANDLLTDAESTEKINPEEKHIGPGQEKKFSGTDISNPVTSPGKKGDTKHAPSFFERHPDMEKFIGENLMNKIGIGVLVLGIGFFVKYAIDKNWIGPIGRVSIGVLCGGILVSVAHKLRNSYRSFSSVLTGGGLAVFYFTITLAYHQFQLFGQATAFVIMIVITIFAVVLSLLYNKQELAIIALVGGFIAPFLISDGSGNYKVLFTYLVILNSGLLVIAYNKAWRILNLLSFIFTVLMFGGWLVLLHNEPNLTYRNGFLFGAIFYLLFFTINIAHNVRERKRFIASDFGILLANTALFFSAGIYCLNKMGAAEFRGLFSASMGIFNLVASFLFFRKQKIDTNILYLLIGITLTFISITAPIQLHGNHITLFWASEAVLLYWLFVKSKLRITQYASVIIWVLMMLSLLMDWMQLYANNDSLVPLIINKGFITTVFAAIATYLLFMIRNREAVPDKNSIADLVPGKNIFRTCAIVLLFAAGGLEINYQFGYYYPGWNFNLLYLLPYTLLFISGLTLITEKIETLRLNLYITLVLLSLCIILYLFSIPQATNTQQQILLQQKNSVHFLAHWIASILTGLILYRLIQLLRKSVKPFNSNSVFVTWILCSIIVIYLSAEIYLMLNHIFYSSDNSLEDIKRIYSKTGLPILWGLCSFAFMWLGMQYKYRVLRIISLSLFSLTLLKLFLFDIRNIPAGGKIAAFICLGILLLVVSFMYQRLKKIIIDNEEKRD